MRNCLVKLKSFSLLAVCFLSLNVLFANEVQNTCFDADHTNEAFGYNTALDCNTAPFMNCASTYFGCPNDSQDPSSTGQTTATPGESGCPDPILTYEDIVMNDQACQKTIKRIWTANYPDNTSPWLFSTCTQMIFLEDVDAPTFSTSPANIAIEVSGANCSSAVTWITPVAVDNCGPVTLTSTHNSGDIFPEGTTTVTYTASDDCGLSSSISFTVTVTCTCGAPPTINCPADYSGCPGSSMDPSNTGTATATPASGCPTPILTYSDQTTVAQNACGEVTVVRTWVASDPNDPSLTASCTQNITLVDHEDPIILNVPGDVNVQGSGANCSAVATWTSPNFTDNCSVAVLSYSHESGSTFPEGTTIVTITATDECGNAQSVTFNVTVTCVCNTPPTILCPANYIGCPASTDPSVTGQATATAAPGCGSPVVTYTDNIITPANSCGELVIERTWTATDSNDSSLSSSCTQTISMTDDSGPVINSLPTNITIAGNGAGCSAVATWTSPGATDNCGGATLTSTHNSGATFSEGVTTVTYTAVDACGNSTSQSFTVTVTCACDTPPTLLCPANYTGCPTSTDPSVTGQATATAISGCGTPVVTFVDNVITPLNSCGEVVIERVWTATDSNDSSLSSSCVQTITMVDDVNPVFSGTPANITISGNGTGCSAVASWSAPTATDNCGNATITSSHSSGTSFNEGVTTVTYTAVDACGNSSSVSFTVTVTCNCNTPPTILCPANYTGCPSSSIDPSSTGTATATAANGCGTPVVTYTDQITNPQNSCGEVTILRTWTATDSDNASLVATCDQTITLVDNTNPVITGTPTNITVTGDVNCNAVVTWTQPTTSDNCGAVALTSSHASGSTFGQGTTSVIYTATDDCGNSVTSSFTVTVECGCTTPPVIQCPTNYFSCIGSSTDPSNTGTATATNADPNCGPIAVTYSDVIIQQTTCVVEIIRVWTATDDNSGLSSSCNQFIGLYDAQAPVVNNVPADLTVEGIGKGCSAPAVWTEPTATDDCGIASITSSHNSGDLFPEGTTIVVYTIVDNCGKTTSVAFMVTVECSCTATPIIQCPDNYFGCAASDYSPAIAGEATATVQPGCGPVDITYTDNIINNPNCKILEIVRIWTATDQASGLSTSCGQFIGLYDTQNPTLTGVPADILIEGSSSVCAQAVTWTPPVANDNCAVTLTSTHNPGDIFQEGTTTVTYTATDGCGATISGSFTVTIECGCTIPPIVTCPSDFYACVGSSIDPAITGTATVVTGSGCNTAVLTYFDTTTQGSCAGAVDIIRTWQAEDPDDSTLSDVCTQTISLSDNEAPVFSNCPHDVTMNTGQICDKPFLWFEPTVTDNCATPTTTVNLPPGSTFSSGTTEVIYTATDDCGNVATCSFTVTINCDNCTDAPILTCPASVTLCPGSDTSPASTGTATATPGSSDCDPPVITHSDFIVNAGPCAGAMVIDRTWTATDPNNSALTVSCVQTITLADTAPPVITGMPHDIIIDGGSGSGCTTSFPWIEPTATDDCGAVQLTSDIASGATFTEGTTTVTYTAVDDCGNTSTDSFTVTVICSTTNQCTQAPIINCPADFASCVSNDYSPAITGYATAQPGSAGCNMPGLTFNDVIVSTGACTGSKVVERTWTATDPDDATLISTCIQTISLNDSQGPAITSGCPSDISVTGDANCTAVVTWSAPTATDNCSSVTTTSSHNSGDSFGQGTTTVTYTFTDDCGNATSCSFNVVVTCAPTCSTPPVIQCPANYSGCPSGNYTPAVTGSATATAGSAICGTPIVTHSDVIISTGSCSGSKVVERTWTATDPNDATLVSTCVQTITLADTTNPTISNCPSNITVTGDAACNAAVTWSAPTVSDNCGSVNITPNYYSGHTFSQGTTTVTYTATDDCGNTSTCSFTVTVNCPPPSCTTPPVINCPGDATVCLTSSLSPSILGNPVVTVGPNCPNPTIGHTDVITSTGPCAGAKVIVRTWTATIPGTNLSSSCDQVINVDDEIAPVILNCPANITVADNTTPATWVEPTATDDCGLQSMTGSHTPGTLFPVGVTNCSYTAIDNCGNTTVCTFTVTVLEPQNPPITCPDDIVVSCGQGGGAHVTFEPPVYNSTCNPCTGQTIPGFIFMGTYNGSQYYCSNAPATWQSAQAVCASNGGYLAVVNDSAENAFLANLLTIQSAYIGLSDHVTEGNFQWVNGDPVTYTNWYAGQPNDYNNNQDYVEMLNNGEWNDQYNYSSLEYIMEIPCTNVIQTAGPTSGSYLTAGTYTVTYTVNDGCNNGASCSFNITVEESITMNCPDDVTLSCPNNTMIVNWQTPTATTCCSNCTAGGQIPGFIYMGSHNGHFYYCSNSPDTWQNAQNTCATYGGYLAVVNDAAENTYLSNLLTIQSAYIGLSDHVLEGSFQWVNGDPVTYTNWYVGQPNNYNNQQDYVEMLNDGTWNDQYDYSSLEYIMEIPGCLNIVQTAGPASGSVFTAGTTTTVEYTATDQCGNVEVCSFDITVESSGCVSAGQNSNDTWISSVVFGQLENVSGNDGGYADYSTSTHCVELEPGETYNLKLTPGYGGATVPVYWSVWVDWNMDGDFTDASEFIAYGAGTKSLSGMIALPSNVWDGTTIMRVVMKVGSYPTSPCEVYPYGETEDYCVRITGAGDLDGGDQVDNRDSSADAILLVGEKIQSKLSVFPNPAINDVTITVDSEASIDNIQIMDVSGRVVETMTNINLNQTNVNVRDLNEGIYFITTQLNDGQILTEKITVEK